MTWEIWQILTRALKSQNWDFDRIILSDVENVWAWNLQGSYVSWQWRMIKNLKRNARVRSKMTWGILRILTAALQNLKNLHFNGLLLTKVYIVWAKKSTGELYLMALKIDAKFGGKLNCAFKNDMRNLANFHRLKNIGFILESKTAGLNQNKNSKQPYRLDAVCKRYATSEINECACLLMTCKLLVL